MSSPIASYFGNTSPRAGAPKAGAEYAELKRRVGEAGLLADQPGYYRIKLVGTLGTLAVAVAVAILAPSAWLILLDAVFLGFASTQVALLAHDIGHRQGFRGRRTNALARFAFGNVLLCVSHSWWSLKHNQHHATPNHVELDPDIQFPMIAFSPEQAAARPRMMRPLIAVQAFIFVLFLPFQALNMRVSSITHLWSKRARRPVLQGALMATHLGLYAGLLIALGNWPLALAFFAIHQATFGLYNSSVFASNHKGMPLMAEGGRLDFLREQVLTARNIRGHRLTDFWYGGLNYQIEHHLFPTMPRNNLAKAQGIVKEFCAEHGITYHTTSLFEGYRETFSHLHRVSAMLRRQPA